MYIEVQCRSSSQLRHDNVISAIDIYVIDKYNVYVSMYVCEEICFSENISSTAHAAARIAPILQVNMGGLA